MRPFTYQREPCLGLLGIVDHSKCLPMQLCHTCVRAPTCKDRCDGVAQVRAGVCGLNRQSHRRLCLLSMHRPCSVMRLSRSRQHCQVSKEIAFYVKALGPGDLLAQTCQVLLLPVPHAAIVLSRGSAIALSRFSCWPSMWTRTLLGGRFSTAIRG